jgi:hypothetical protein
MTMITYAAVNMTKATLPARTTIAAMIKQVTSAGQESGTAVGQLPTGYLPLTPELQAQASSAATTILSFVLPTPITIPTRSNGIAQDSSSSTATGSELDTLPGAADPTVTSGVDSAATGRTETSPDQVVARSGLVISLGVGLAGVLIAPFLFRGRGFF